MKVSEVRRWAVVGVLALAAGVVWAPPAAAQALSYSTASRSIKVCNLILESQMSSPPVAPYLFHLLESRPDLKPAGWVLENPLAAPRADDLVRRRWGNVYGNLPITRSMAAYWEVYSERVSPQDLAEFDVIYVGGAFGGSARGGARSALVETPTARERDLLRKAVDAGATLWLEDAGGWRIDGRLFFGAAFQSSSPRGTPVVLQPVHPLLNRPYRLTVGDLQTIFPANVRTIAAAPDSLEPTVVQGVAQSGGRGIFLAHGPYGGGHIVMIGAGTGAALSGAIRAGGEPGFRPGNLGPASGRDFSQIPPAAMKFAYNLMSLSLESAQERGTPRRSGSTLEQVGSPLTRKWTFPSGPNDPTLNGGWVPSFRNSAAPAVYKDVVFVPAANGVLYALDLEPSRDLDGDGNPDDGIPVGASTTIPYDLSMGAPYDILWAYDLGSQITGEGGTGKISSPVLATVDGRDVLYITTEDGTLWAFDAFPTTPRGQLQFEGKVLWSKSIGASYTGAVSGQLELRIPAPVFYAGRLFVAANDDQDPRQGRVMELNPSNGAVLWQYSRTTKPLVAQPPALGRILATPAVAWIHDERTDAMDLVMYVPTLSDVQNGQTGRVFSFLLSVRNERLDPVAGDPRRFRSRHSVAPQHFPWLQDRRRVWVPSNPGVLASYDPAAPGQVRLSQAVPPGTEVRADYDVDPSADQYKPRSTFFAPPPTQSSAADFLSTPVVAPDDTVYLIATDVSAGRSTLYAVREQAPLAFVRWRYSLPDTVVWGPPAYHKGVLYVGTGQGRIIGFDTRATFKIDLNGIVDLGRKYAISFLQRDPMLPATYAQNSYSFIQGQYEVNNVTTVDATGRVFEHGQILIRQFSIAGSNSLDASQPITVRYPVPNSGNQAEETTEIRVEIDPALAANPNLFSGSSGNQANKIFDLAVPTGFGGSIVAGPTIAGDTMYVATGDGSVASFPADPRILKAQQSVAPRAATIPLARVLAMPPREEPGPITAPIVASGGNLVLNTGGGVMVFHQPVSLIADANRILEVRNSYNLDDLSPGGSAVPEGSEVLWSLNSTERRVTFPDPGLVMPVPIGAALEPEVRSLSHPAVALRLSNADFLIADTGNNRVVEVDRGGQVIWELTTFADPLSILGGSEPLSLSTPTDVQRWYTVRRDSSGRPLATETHTLVVDAGHNRVLEIRDTHPVDPRSGLQEYHVLVWASRTTGQGKSYVYRNAQRLPDGTTIATVLNYSVNSIDGSVPDTPGSSVVLLSPRTESGGRIVDPGGRVIAYMNTLIFPQGFELPEGGVAQVDTERPIFNPAYLHRFFTGIGTQRPRALLVTGRGVYEVEAQPVGGTVERGKVNLVVVDQLKPPTGPGSGGTFGPTIGVVSAKRLASGNTLITNQTLSMVFEFDPVQQQATGNGYILISPITSGTHSLLQPSYADRTE